MVEITVILTVVFSIMVFIVIHYKSKAKMYKISMELALELSNKNFQDYLKIDKKYNETYMLYLEEEARRIRLEEKLKKEKLYNEAEALYLLKERENYTFEIIKGSGEAHLHWETLEVWFEKIKKEKL